MYSNQLSLLFLILLCSLMGVALSAQLSITSSATNYTINFDQTVDGVNNGVFTGAGFTPSPGSGQLDSDAWRAFGSNNMGTFGGTHTSGAFARGASAGGVMNGNPNSGIYGFDRDGSTAVNRAFGIQHFAGMGGNVFTPGYFTLRIQNNTGSTIQDLSIGYKIFVYNDKDGTSSFNFSHSSHGSQSMSWTNESSLNYTSPGQASTPASWSSANNRSIILENLNIPDGSYYFLRWTINDASGSGQRDEIALDDIEINVVQLLPVEWASFNVRKQNEQSVLEWSTLQEINNDYFLVEHSTNGRNWSNIGKVKGNSTTNDQHQYSYVHEFPSLGQNYYRIQQIDQDGSKEYSPVRQIFYSKTTSKSINVFPNPVYQNAQIQLKSSARIISVTLINSAGGIVKRWPGNMRTLDVSGLSSGTYFLQIEMPSENITKRIVLLP